MENKNGLAINNEVVAQIASLAALEVDGVAGMSQRPINIKGVFAKSSQTKAVKVNVLSGLIEIDIYIKLNENSRVKTVAEEVQSNVKDKVQTMIGSAVAKVNVYIAGIAFDDEKPVA